MPLPHERFQQLSRFFFAANADEMLEPYLALANGLPAPTVNDWSAVEFSFNYLFVGPRALLAPPYASIYLDGEHASLMGESTEKIRNLYEMVGLTSPWLNKIPDDHLALELDALWQMDEALLRVDSPQLRDVQEFLLAHLQSWLPKFASRVRSVDDVHPAILFVIDCLLAEVFNNVPTAVFESTAC